MAKRKISVTLSPDRIVQAQQLTGNTNLSEIVDEGLEALIERELEKRWMAGHQLELETDLPQEVPVDLSDLPWESS